MLFSNRHRHTVVQGTSFSAEILSCQTSLELKQQYKPDLIQRIIIYLVCVLIGLTTLGTLIDRYWPQLALVPTNSQPAEFSSGDSVYSETTTTRATATTGACFGSQIVALVFQILTCFSLIKNWNIFIGKEQQLESGEQWDCFTNNKSNASPDRTLSPSLNSAASVAATGSRVISREPSFLIDSPAAAVATTENSDLSNMVAAPASFRQHQKKNVTTIDNNNNGGYCKDEKRLLHQLSGNLQSLAPQTRSPSPATTTVRGYLKQQTQENSPPISLSHLYGLKLVVILWITLGHSFLYPSAHNYQYYRSIISIKLTKDSVWFAITNFTLGIDMILYMAGLVFVYKVTNLSSSIMSNIEADRKGTNKKNHKKGEGKIGAAPESGLIRLRASIGGVARVIFKKILKLWPTYLSLIALAILMPMLNDGPLWPEMVTKRLGESCRKNWWSNILFINNFGFSESEICLPSSWFISVLMQLFLIGSLIIALVQLISLEFALTILALLLFGSCAGSFAYAYWLNLRAPIIVLDETFAMELNENLFKLYTNTINSLGPFLIGMVGGFILNCAQIQHEQNKNNRVQRNRETKSPSFFSSSSSSSSSSKTAKPQRLDAIFKSSIQALVSFSVLLIALLVLSSVFYQEYSRFWAAIYWALHRVGWAIATGYLIHNCATGRWLLLRDLLSLSSFAPLGKLIFIAYLVNPIYIHVHSGLVRDGLHVSTYNMLNIYTARLVMTFVTALFIHLIVELPFNSIEEIYFNSWIKGRFKLVPKVVQSNSTSKFQPLLATISLNSESATIGTAQEMNCLDATEKRPDEHPQLKQ